MGVFGGGGGSRKSNYIECLVSEIMVLIQRLY